MKVALINPGKKKVFFAAPLSLCYLASYAREHTKKKLDIIIIDEPIGQDAEKILSDFKPDIVGISTLTTVSKRAYEIAEFSKKKFNSLNIIGGVHATVSREKILNESLFDIVVVGEGENTFTDIINSKSLHEIDGIIFRDKGKIIINPERELIKNLDEIPYPAWDLVNMEFYLSRKDQIPDLNKRTINIITTRGCPYNCVFCSVNKTFKGVIRFHSFEYVRGMIESLKKYNVEAIYFGDDTFTISSKRLEEICGYMKNSGLKFFCLGRANLVNREMLVMLKESGCVGIGFGFESMSENVLKYLKRGTVTVEQNKKAVELCKGVGMSIQAYFMIGNPNETREDIQKTVDFIDKEGIIPTFFITSPFPGTELYDWCVTNNLIPKEVDWENVEASSSYTSNVHASNTLSKKEVASIFLELNKKYYLKSFSKLEILKKILLRPKESFIMIKDSIIKK